MRYEQQTPIILLALLSLFLCCDNGAGFSGVSNNIKESKGRGVFIQEYEVIPNPYKINDSLQITVKEAWIENSWGHSKDPANTVKGEKYQLCINSLATDLKGFSFDWSIGNNFKDNFRISGKNSLMVDRNTLPTDSIIKYSVFQGEFLLSDTSKIPIGKFELHRKN